MLRVCVLALWGRFTRAQFCCALCVRSCGFPARKRGRDKVLVLLPSVTHWMSVFTTYCWFGVLFIKGGRSVLINWIFMAIKCFVLLLEILNRFKIKETTCAIGKRT